MLLIIGTSMAPAPPARPVFVGREEWLVRGTLALADRGVRARRWARAHAWTRDESRGMMQATAILFCDGCETATTRSERGWRAYLREGDGGAEALEVLCPLCAESVVGEDEAAWSD